MTTPKWLLIFFGLSFACISVWSGVGCFAELSAPLSTSGWLRVPATVLSAELKTSKDRKGSQTYQALTSYRYKVAGLECKSDIIRAQDSRSSTDNIGDYHQNWYARLSEAKQFQRPLMAFVHPTDPTRAVLSNEIRWSMALLQGLSMVLFGVFGFGALAVALFPKLPIFTQMRG